jgi:hypothetical protein
MRTKVIISLNLPSFTFINFSKQYQCLSFTLTSPHLPVVSNQVWGRRDKKGGADDATSLKRHKTKYAGVFFIEVDGPMGSEKVYYIRYRRHGKAVEEKAGCQYRDDMTPSRASGRRADRIAGKEPTNSEKREAEQTAKVAESQIKTINNIWIHYPYNDTWYATFNSASFRFR